MMKPQVFVMVLLIVLLCSFGVVDAQQTRSPEQDLRMREALLRAQAFELLESLSDQLGTLQSAENRARLGSNIAGSLWNHNEKRARTLLVSVENEIRSVLQAPKSDDPGEKHTLSVFLRLRMDTIDRIAKHDPELAFAFLKGTKPRPDARLPYDVKERERAVEIRLMGQIAANNPELALKLGRRSLEAGFSQELLELLWQLQRKNREPVQVLYNEILLKLRGADLTRQEDARAFALSLAYNFGPPTVDETRFRDLITMIITSGLTNGCAQERSRFPERAQFCRQIAALVPLIEKIDPGRAAQFSHWSPEVPRWEPVQQELVNIAQSGTVEQILELAAKYPHLKTQVYWQAMMKATELGDMELAQKIASELGGDPKAFMLEQYDKWVSMTDEQLAETERSINSLPGGDRARSLLYLAVRIGPNRRAATLKILDQAAGIIDSMKPSKDQTEMQLILAVSYCLERSDRAFTIMEAMLPKLNELVAAAAKLDGFDNRYLRDGEWNMTSEGGVGNLLTNLANNAGHFAWCDFNRAVSLATQFERQELRLMAQLKLAQGILAGPPKRRISTRFL